MVPVVTASGTGLAGMETRVMREGSRPPYSRAAGSLNPTGGQKLTRPGAPQLAGTSRKSRIFSTYCPLVAPRRDPHMGLAQAPSGLRKQTGPARWADHPHFAQPRGYAMRTFDLAPLYRSTVGFYQLLSLLVVFVAAQGFPSLNLQRTGENAYRISVAVAGFGENEL